MRAVKDLDDSHLALEPRPGLKTAGWLIGHLATTGDFAASDAAMARESPYEPARRPFPRAGDFAGYLMSGHFAYHVGQLSAWRAGARLPVLGTE